jgi:hypothetical protein
MAIKIVYTSTRPDTSSPFWVDSSDPIIVSFKDRIFETINKFIISKSVEYSEDMLEMRNIYVFRSIQVFETYRDNAANLIPEFIEKRNDYFRKHNHGMKIEIFDRDGTKTAEKELIFN